jgi:hypothetical protein
MNEPWENMDSQDSPRFGLGGSHHLPPYSIPCAWPWGLPPNIIFSQGSQVKNLKILEIETPKTLETHNVFCRPLIEVTFKENL